MASNNSTTAESFTNTSVEYFLLDNNKNGVGETTGEILSPIPYRVVDSSDSSARIARHQRRIDGDEEEDLTSLPSNLGMRSPPPSGGGVQEQEELLLSSSSYLPDRDHRNNNTTELSGLNCLNALTYAVHVFVWCVVGVWGLDGVLMTRWEVTKRFETLATPCDWAFNYLWIPILVAQGVFTVAQLLPHYRARPVVGATSYFFFYTALLQIAYTFLFSFRLFIFSFVAAVLALLSLLSLLISQEYHGDSSLAPLSSTSSNQRYHHHNYYYYQYNRRAGSWTEYIFFRLPFLLHLGWILLMVADHFSLLFRYYSGDTGLQLAADIVSLGILLPVATFALFRSSGPDFVIPLVILYSYIGIACRLANPSNAMMELYGPVVIEGVFIATCIFAGFLGCCIIPCIVIILAREFCTINVVELD